MGVDICSQLYANAAFKAPDRHQTGDRWGSNTSFDVVVKTKIPAQSVWPVVSHVTNCSILTHKGYFVANIIYGRQLNLTQTSNNYWGGGSIILHFIKLSSEKNKISAPKCERSNPRPVGLLDRKIKREKKIRKMDNRITMHYTHYGIWTISNVNICSLNFAVCDSKPMPHFFRCTISKNHILYLVKLVALKFS
jgi:hypothetical protein